MTEPIATFNSDFLTTRQFKAVLDPATVVAGKPFKIRCYSPAAITLLSHYGTLAGPVAETEDIKTEIIALGGTAEYPIAQIITQKLSNNIVNIDDKSLAALAGDEVTDELTDNELLLGSVYLKYQTFNQQVFSHTAITTPGDCCIWAITPDGCAFEIRFNVSQEEESEPLSGITLEGHDRNLANGAYQSHTFRLHPAANNIAVKTRQGTIVEIPAQLVMINDSVNFSNSDTASGKHEIASLAYPIDVSSGFFLNDNGDEVTPGVWISDGKVKLSQKVASGVISLTYYAAFRMFNFFRQKDTLSNTWYRGAAVAYRKEDGAFAVYDIPIATDLGSPKQVVAKIYRKILVAERGSSLSGNYEYPTTFNETTIGYDSYPAANTSALTTESPEIKVYQVQVYWDGISCWSSDNEGLEDWAYPCPTSVTPFLDISWQYEENLPPDLDGYQVAQINYEINRVKTKYGIA